MNIFRSANWIAAFISLLTVCALAVWLSRLPEKFSILLLAIATIIGGTLGNLLDRLLHGHVVDFIQLYWGEWSFYIFNIADVCIIGGVGSLIFTSLRDTHLKSR
jgi:signal peptidase II